MTHGVRRLAAKNLRAAADELERGATDVPVHAARKRVKKVRALAHLVSSDRGRHLKGSGQRLRALNRSLSTLRDCDATLEILETIRRTNPDVVSEHTFARLRRMLAQHRHDIMRAARGGGLFDDIVTELRALEKGAKRWRTRRDNFAALARGIRATHRHGRAAMARAVDSNRAADFHDWRKEIKTLWYELRLLAATGGRVQKDVASLHAAEALLGDDHNLTVLCSRLEEAAPMVAAADVEALRSAAERYQRELRRKAIAKARPIFTASSKSYVDEIKRAFKQWRRRPSSPNKRTTAA